jgi:hypothetical protein
MAFAVTHDSFTAGQPAIASQVNTNFNDVEAELNDFPTDGSLADGAVSSTAKLANSIITTAKFAATAFKDEDDMASDLATAVPSQQSVKAYADTGSNVTHDTEGGYNNCDINGTKTKVYTKYFTGTLDADSATAVAHGEDFDKILHVSAMVYDDNLTEYAVSDYRLGASSGHGFQINVDATNINLDGVETYIQGNNYRIKVDYYL